MFLLFKKPQKEIEKRVHACVNGRVRACATLPSAVTRRRSCRPAVAVGGVSTENRRGKKLRNSSHSSDSRPRRKQRHDKLMKKMGAGEKEGGREGENITVNCTVGTVTLRIYLPFCLAPFLRRNRTLPKAEWKE